MSKLQITFRSITHSAAIEQHIQKYFNRVHRIYHKILHCHVVIDFEKKHNLKDRIFTISIDARMPGKKLVSKKQSHDLYIAIRDGFDTIEKLLEKHCKRKPILTKKHFVYLQNMKNPISQTSI